MEGCPHCREDHPVDQGFCPITGRALVDQGSAVLAPGEVVDGKYKVVSELGAGAMGVVYEARHLALGRRVAMKTLRQELGEDPELAVRFQQEARAASAIGHPNIVDVFDLGRTGDGRLYMVMELLDGRSLATILEDTPKLPIDKAVQLMAQVLGALGAAHKNGIVHRDLKPDNIFVVETEERPSFVKLLDFGISKFLAERTSQKMQAVKDAFALAAHATAFGSVLGTPAYMAPEQARGQVELIDARTDLYAAGVCLYQMLCGRTPFLGNNYNAVLAAIVEGEYPMPRRLRGDLPVTLERVITTALAKRRDDRYPSAAAMRDAMMAAAGGRAAGVSGANVLELDLATEGVASLELDLPSSSSMRGTPRPSPTPIPAAPVKIPAALVATMPSKPVRLEDEVSALGTPGPAVPTPAVLAPAPAPVAPAASGPTPSAPAPSSTPNTPRESAPAKAPATTTPAATPLPPPKFISEPGGDDALFRPPDDNAPPAKLLTFTTPSTARRPPTATATALRQRAAADVDRGVRRRRSPARALALLVLLGAIAAGYLLVWRPRMERQPRGWETGFAIVPPNASVQLDDRPSVRSPLWLRPGSVHTALLSAPNRLSRKIYFSATPGQEISVRLPHAIAPLSPRDPPPERDELAALYPQVPAGLAEIDAALDEISAYETCLDPMSRAHCRTRLEALSLSPPPFRSLEAAATAYVAAPTDASKPGPAELAFRSELLAARTQWELEELARLEQDQGRKAEWYMRAVVLAARAVARGRPVPVGDSLRSLGKEFAAYRRDHPSELARMGGAVELINAATEMEALIERAPRDRAALASAFNRLAEAFDALVLQD